MLLSVPNVLTAAQLSQIRELLQSQPAPQLTHLHHLIVQALNAHPVFSMAAMVKTYRPIAISRLEVGTNDGAQADSALQTQIRDDLSFTIFLNEPEDYDGGALIIDEASGTRDLKLSAGTAVLFPGSSLHRVEPITRGTRLAASGCLQSLIRRADQREILFELEALRRRMFLDQGKTAAFDTLSKNVANLWRMWVEP